MIRDKYDGPYVFKDHAYIFSNKVCTTPSSGQEGFPGPVTLGVLYIIAYSEGPPMLSRERLD